MGRPGSPDLQPGGWRSRLRSWDGPLEDTLLDGVTAGKFEDFVTSAFCWLLSNVPRLGPDFLNFLRFQEGGNRIPELDEDRLDWDTQTSFGRDGEWPVRPDMTCTDKDRKNGVVFEHKVWSFLHPDQLANYREHAPQPFRNGPIVLVTAHRGQHDQGPDLALCWSDVHCFLSSGRPCGDAGFAVRAFLTLLERRGLGPLKELRIEDVRRFRPLERPLRPIMESVAQREWPGVGEKKVRSKWGRLGFRVRDDWNPGLFVGVLLDGWDHCVPPSVQGPYACVIVDVEPSFNEHPALQRLAEALEGCLPDGWCIYRHMEDQYVIKNRYGYHEKPNPWHPLHLRRPLADVLGSENGERQAQRFYEQTYAVVEQVEKNIEAPWTPA